MVCSTVVNPSLQTKEEDIKPTVMNTDTCMASLERCLFCVKFSRDDKHAYDDLNVAKF